MFNITRTLNETLSLPLISMMLADNMTAKFNGTLINCSGISQANMMNTMSTRIHIIENGTEYSMFTLMDQVLIY